MTFIYQIAILLKDVKTSDRDVSENVSQGNPGNKNYL